MGNQLIIGGQGSQEEAEEVKQTQENGNNEQEQPVVQDESEVVVAPVVNTEAPIAVQIDAVPGNQNNESAEYNPDDMEFVDAEGEDILEAEGEEGLVIDHDLLLEAQAEGDTEMISSSEEEKEIEGEDITKNGCSHYARNCELFCHQCEKYFACRFCHDEFWENNIKEIKKFHNFDRFNVQKIKCIGCEHEQTPQEK